MEFSIIWSEFAETQLDEIYEYYEANASYRIAKKIYSIDKEAGFIKIADVFDTIQNPIKMKRTK